jgi:methyltransferase (TIGR00027 family)
MSEQVQHVSDTALLAAGWRAMESSRPDALFHDPLAADLAGERGLQIARTLPDGWWVVAIRTVIIDAFLSTAISSGIDTVINIGAGLDTRPYRMDLPSSLRWFEVVDPGLIEPKNARLANETPTCSLERFGLDLTERGPRRELFDRIGASSRRALALTEGVLSYLSVDEAGSLAEDLRALPACELWVTEYLSPRVVRYQLKHQSFRYAPLRFDAPSWEAFLAEHGWAIGEIRYLGEESERLHRPVPLPLLDRVARLFTSRPLRDRAYAILERVE